ncbi:hypothetical protein NX862_13990 [Rhodobacter sp. KR11]|uniref:hypothetical protein n=1 Tax=Rhodobacter sp. KR11 TaxID=2974588 RepID=UPI00222235B8|nr:hypothetical protein [Rhodobacter sp. KR11]MCW1919867.1 hypothetical protein [Rhodobacter sp. KR11]
MKPTFALDFRDGQITLLHRTSRGWSLVGSAAFGAPEFDETLAYLRSTALGLQPRGITTKLILPNDQVLYTEVEVGASDGSRRRRLIRLALEGRTPYPVDDLVWDWSGEGSTVKVAVIARETLAEAESFAAAHRFNPVSFVAVPEGAEFDGEPFFGPTALAPQVLGEADKVERDAEPVVILREAPKPEPGPLLTEADLAPPVQDARDIEAEAEAADRLAAAQAAAPDPDLSELEPVAEVAAEVAAEPVAEVAAAPGAEVMPEPVRASDPAGRTEPEGKTEALPDAAPKAEASQVAEPAPKAGPAAKDKSADQRPAPDHLADEAPMALDVMADPAVEDDLPPAPAAAISAAFASRKAGEKPDEAKSIGGVSRPGARVEAPRSEASRPDAARPDAARPDVPRPDLARPAVKAPVKGETLAFPAKGGKAAKGKPLGVTATTIAGMSRRDKVVTLPTAAASPATAAEAGDKPARPAPVIKGRTPIGGKPRYLGLILTVALLVLLAAVAVWSSFFMGTSEAVDPTSSGTPTDGNAASLSQPADPVAEALTDGGAGNSAGTSAGTSADEVATAAPVVEGGVSEGAGVEATASDAATPDPATPDLAATVTEPAPEAGPAETLAAAAPEAAPDTGLATLSAPEAGQAAASGTAGIKLASADAPPGVAPPQELAPLAAGVDSEPAAPPAPPPFGTVYKFDANGLIEPTPEGIMTPEGVLLVAGKPALVPPSRPAELTVASAPAAAAPTAGVTADGLPAAAPATPGGIALDPAALPAPASPSEPIADPAPVADPALQGKRPQSRPEGLVAPASDTTAAPIQDGALAAPQDPTLAALRPQARPEGLTPPAAPTEPAAPNNASLVASGAPLLTAPVTRAPRPPIKPTDLNRAVDDAITAALDQPAAQDTAAQDATIQDEPEPDNGAPTLPTNASVAKQATTKDALNTRKLALLAVYGTASNRFAMVRQPNGAVKKVRVGDAIDGGTVNAITANAIEYQKGGRMVTLALPTG